MSWAKLDDAMGEHRKIRRALRAGGLDAIGLHVLGILHCARYLTDGFVEDEFVTDTFDLGRIKPKDRTAATDALEANGLWTREDEGWRIHGYLEYNPTRLDVEDRRRRDAERKANGRRTQSTRSPRGQDADSERTGIGLRAVSDGPVPSRPLPTPELPTPTPPKLGWANGGHDFFDEVKAQLRDRLGDASYETWIAPVEVVTSTEQALILDAPASLRSWIAERYLPLIAQLVGEATGRPAPVVAWVRSEAEDAATVIEDAKRIRRQRRAERVVASEEGAA